MVKAKEFTLRFACATVVALFVIGAAEAQSGRRLPTTSPQDQDKPLRLRAEEVLLNVTVTDPYGRQATDLGKDEFIIAEDGKRQDMSSFALSSVPINVVLLLDASGSVVGEISSLRNAAMKFVEKLGPEDKVSVIEFHTKVELIQDWTSSADDLRHAITWRFRPGTTRTQEGTLLPGTTSLYDALYLATNDQLSKVEGRKAIIMLTDGDDTSSKVTYNQALSSIVKSGATVYVVSKARAFLAQIDRYRGRLGRVLGGGTAQQADIIAARLENAERLMTDIAKRTGGRIFSPLEDKDMEDVYTDVARELKNQYIITYIPTNEDRNGALRHINLYLTRPGYSARTRDSYYAPREEN